MGAKDLGIGRARPERGSRASRKAPEASEPLAQARVLPHREAVPRAAAEGRSDRRSGASRRARELVARRPESIRIQASCPSPTTTASPRRASASTARATPSRAWRFPTPRRWCRSRRPIEPALATGEPRAAQAACQALVDALNAQLGTPPVRARILARRPERRGRRAARPLRAGQRRQGRARERLDAHRGARRRGEVPHVPAHAACTRCATTSTTSSTSSRRRSTPRASTRASRRWCASFSGEPPAAAAKDGALAVARAAAARVGIVVLLQLLRGTRLPSPSAPSPPAPGSRPRVPCSSLLELLGGERLRRPSLPRPSPPSSGPAAARRSRPRSRRPRVASAMATRLLWFHDRRTGRTARRRASRTPACDSAPSSPAAAAAA